MASRPRSGTGYIGLEQWLGQNQQQAAAMGNALADGIDAQARGAENHLSYVNEAFDAGTDAAALNFADQPIYNPDGTPLHPLASMDRQAEAAKKFVDAGYGGPKSLGEFAEFGTGKGMARDAQRDAGLASDFYGRQALLQGKAGKGGGYSLGQQRLDSALVGASSGDRLDATKAQWGGILGRFDAADTRAKGIATSREQGNKDAAKQYADEAKARHDAAKAVHDEQKKAAKPVLTAEKLAEKEAREKERIAERERQKREDAGGKMGGGKANVDRWTDAYLF